MLCYVTSQILGLIGLYPFANVLNLVMMATFMLLMTWAYVRYTGNMSEVGSTIDNIAVTIWDNAIQPFASKMAEEGANYATRQAVQRLNSTTTAPNPMSLKKRQ
jgi:atlastin